MKRSRSFVQFGSGALCAVFASLWLVLVGTNTLAIAQTNVPTLTSLAPNSAQAGTPGITLNVNGVNFDRFTTVRWNGVDRVTTFVSTNQLTAQITAADLQTPGTAQVTAFKSSLGGGLSNPLTFTITQPPPPAPTLTSLNPNSATAGGSAFTLIATGTGFVSTSVLRWNGANRPTNVISATQLSAQIPASDIASAGSASVTVFTPPLAGVGGGTSNALTFTINPPINPAPVLTSLSPNQAVAGSGAFTLTVTGANFSNAAIVRWNGNNRTPTQFISTTQLTVLIPASDIATPGTASVTVINPSSGGGGGSVSNPLPFTITAAPNPVPTLTSITPNSANAGSAGFTLTLTGTNFINTSVARWNGSDRPTTFISATQLMAQIPATDVANAGSASIVVFNPPNAGVGGGTSNALPFTINQQQNPVPTLISATPNPILAGTPGVTLLVTGTNFVAGSVLRWNGANRQTTFIAPSQLSVLIPASDIDIAGTASIVVFNPAPGGGPSNALTININNPAPVAISITPNNTIAGSPAFTLTVNGSGFIAGSVVRWNGQNRTTQFVNAAQLTAQILATDVANAGTANVTVFNPPNGGGTSNPVPFTINVAPNPAPRLTAINPSSANAGSAGFTLTATGANFINGSVVRWNGVDRPTTFISATQLTAQIPATDIANVGTANVTVFNPPNASGGGGASNPLPFTINQAPAPVPTLTSLNPNTANAGGAGFALMVTGTNFINTSVVRWNGANRPTTIISATQLIAQIPATDIANAGAATITVLNPPNTAGVGGGTSNALTFTIAQQQNPVPTLTSATPIPITAGTQGVTLLVTGTNFVANSVVRWNGATRTTMFVSATQLSAQIPASDLLNAGPASLSVFNPAPGGGTSNTLTINVNNPVPTIAALVPNSIVAGSADFTLTISGNGFIPASVVRWNGANRPSRFVSGTQLTVQVPASDVANTGTAQITVVNPASSTGGGGGTSNAAVFTITPRPLPPPMLMSVTASAVAQGARQVRLTLIGTNFRPGARVVIGASESNTALVPAPDILVESVNRANETTIYAIVSVANNASLNMRAVDVVNADLTNTTARGSQTTKPLRVQGGTSLGAPLQITSVLIITPRTGTVIAQGEKLFAEAVLAGAGTGTVIGQWLWDGNVTEQFAINFTAGERKTIRPNNPLPTIYLGPHRLEIKITSPNLIQSPVVEVIVNNGTWKMLRLLEPNSGAGFVAEQPPLLRWTMVPGAMKYQIGFSPQPFFNTITQWHDVNGTEWQVPQYVWQMLPEGELWWTARVVETSGNLRQPAAMRRIHRLTAGALKPLALTSPTDTTVLEWQPLRVSVIYRVTITSDLAGKLVIKRFATANSKLDVRKLSDKFQPGVLYYWRVEAFNLKGRLLMTSERYNFLPKPQRTGLSLPLEKLDWQISLPEAAPGVTSKADGTEMQANVVESGSGPSHEQVDSFSQRADVPQAVSAASSAQPEFASLATPMIVGEHGWDLGKAKQRVAAQTQSQPKPQPESQTQAPKAAAEQQPEPAPQTPQTITPPPQSAKLSAMIGARTPQPDAVVKTLTPAVSIDFTAPIKPSEVGLQIDDTDYSALAKITAQQIAFQPTIPLANGQHQIILNVGAEALGWFFTVKAAASAEEADAETKGTDAEQTAEPTATANAEAAAAADAAQQAAAADPIVPVVEKEFTWEASSNQQNVSGSEQDAHNLSLSMQGRYKNGPWLTEMNGSGLLNSLLSPRPRHSLGRFNDYILHFGREWPFGAASPTAQPDPTTGQLGLPVPKWGVDVRFGMISPQSFLNAEYLSTGFAREGVEAAFKTPGGTFGFYRNTNDKGQGEGIGFGFHQRVYGGSYDAPAFTRDPERVKFRLMWMSANDVGGHPLKIGYDEEGNPLTQIDAFATPRVGDSYGSLLSVKLNKDWNWVSEYAITSNNVNRLAQDARRQFGRAWRTGFVGMWHKANISLSFRDVSPNYAIPATASLTQLSASDRRGVDFAISRDTRYGTFAGQYQYLQSDFRYDDRAHVGLNNVNLNWTKQLTQTTLKNSTFSTLLSFGTNFARTTTSNRERPGIIGLADQGRDGVNVNVTETIQTQQLGTLSITVGGSRNWFRDTVNERANNIITALNFATNWTPANPWFQWNANVSVNWLAGERFSVGGSRMLTAYIQPTFNWTRTGLSLTPLVTLNQMSSQMLQLLENEPIRRLTTGDMWMTNYGGRLSWQLPGKYRFNVFSFEGSQAWMRDGISGMTQRTPRLLFLWTIVQPTKPAPPREEKQPPQEAQPAETKPASTPAAPATAKGE